MAEIVSDILVLAGAGDVPPSTLADLIPWLVRITVGVASISGVFAVIGKLVEVFSYRRW